MREVVQINGRWVQKPVDLGPVPPPASQRALNAMSIALGAPAPHKSSICWVCGRKLGPAVGPIGRSMCSVVRDPIGLEHRVHHVCVADADGKLIRKELVAEEAARS